MRCDSSRWRQMQEWGWNPRSDEIRDSGEEVLQAAHQVVVEVVVADDDDDDDAGLYAGRALWR